ncbi:tape measure protein [Rathayibacter soli]|uniref:tape measure protein n=1 Tax=Rathayibacter soli TaxID=3144168 RepID=UPI0027E40161|nr:tape measure protein [Glaciibacter superstes]
MSDNRTVKVTLKAEVAAYVANIARSADATNKLGSAAGTAGSDIERAMAQSERATKSSEQTFTRWGAKTKLAIAAVVLAAGGLFAAFLNQGIDANSFAEQNQIALTTMLGDAKAAKAALDDVYGLAVETPFQFPVLTEQYKTFVAAGMDVQKIIPVMHAYSAAVAAMGGDGAKLEQVSDAISKMATKGQADALQLNSLALAGIPVWQMLADEAGKSVSAVQKDVTAGLYDADRAITIITAGMEEKFGGMLANMGDSYARWQDKTASASRRTAQELAAPLQDVGKEIMRSLTSVFNATTAALKGVDWDPAMQPLMLIPRILDEIAAQISTGGVQNIVDGIGHALDLLSTASEAAFRAATPLVQLLSQAVLAGVPVLDVLTGLLNVFNALPAPIQGAIGALVLFSAIQKTTAYRDAAFDLKHMAWQFTALRQEAVVAGAALPGVTAALGVTTSAARSAGSALLGAFGGPVGLAVAGGIALVTAALSSWTAATDAQEQAVATLSATLDQNTGAITEATARTIVDALDSSGALKEMESLGIATDAVVDGILHGGAAFDSITAGLKRSIKEADELKKLLLLAQRSASEAETGILDRGSASQRALDAINTQAKSFSSSLDDVQRKARAAGDAVNAIDGPVTIDTTQADAALKDLISLASKAAASFIDLAPQKKKATGGGGGGGDSGESAAVKAAKAESAAVKKSADADKKAASDHEKAAQVKAKSAKDAADAAEKAANDAADAYKKASDDLDESTFRWVSAQRQRQAIERTLAAETDPVRKQQLSQALADAVAYEAEMLNRKTTAETTAAVATATNTAAQANATSTTQAASVAQAEYEAASAAAAAMQEAASARIEAASERLAAATEAAAGRAGGAVAGFAADATESLSEYMARLSEQITAQEKWRDNMILLSGKVSSGTLSALLDMGVGGAGLVAELVSSTDDKMTEFSDLMDRATSSSSATLISGMEMLSTLIPAITAKFGKDASDNLKREFLDGKLSIDQIMTSLGASWDGKRLTMHVDANTQAAINSAGGLVNWINQQRATITVSAHDQMAIPGGKNIAFAEGGAVDGPGPKGIDSVYAMLAPGEHVLTASDVVQLGGQAGVFALRRALHDRMPRYADGGPVGYYPPQFTETSHRASEGGFTIYQNIYYPQAEPTSVLTNRTIARQVG